MSNILIAAVQQSVAFIPSQAPVLVAFSGGLDSSVLLHSLVDGLALGVDHELTAVHVHHGLSPNADAWQQHCKSFAEQYGVNFISEQVALKPEAGNLEAQARQARYAVFAEHLPTGGWLLLGHHQNDQEETILLRLMRGAGPKGLSGMARQRPFAQGQLLRPMLGLNKQELVRYAEQHQLGWINDESNANNHFDRNFLRNRILPELKLRWPGSSQTIARAANLMSEYDQLAQILAEQDLKQCDLKSERSGYSVDDSSWWDWPNIRRANLVRLLLHKLQFPETSEAILGQIDQQFFTSHYHTDSKAQVEWLGVSLHRYKNRLFFVDNRFLHKGLWSPAQQHQWSGQQPLVLADGSQLSLVAGGRFNWDGKPLTVCFRQGGERSKPTQRPHSQTLKKLLQEVELEPWLRERLPLIRQAGNTVAVGDLWVEQGFTVEDLNLGYRFEWQQPKGDEKFEQNQ